MTPYIHIDIENANDEQLVDLKNEIVSYLTQDTKGYKIISEQVNALLEIERELTLRENN